MTGDDFIRFLATSKSAFPAIASHFDSGDQSEAASLWQQALEDVDIRLAIAALEQMVRGDLPRPEYGWADFPRLIRQGAAQIEAIEAAQRREEYDERDAARCPICRDDQLGEIRVWNPWLVDDRGEQLTHCHELSQVREILAKWHRADVRRRPGGLHLAAVCSCESYQAKRKRLLLDDYQRVPHDQRSAWRRKNTLPGVVGTYDQKKFCQWSEMENEEERIRLFGEWYANTRDVAVARYEEFDEWAN